MKQFIKNTEDQKICVLVEGEENKTNHKLVFIQPGLSSFKEYYVIRNIAEAFLSNGYVVISFDPRYSFGESDGDLQYSTLSNSFSDLETVINWAKDQDFYVEPFALSGHSLGGGSVLHYAELYPEKISDLVSVGAMVGGKYYLRSYMMNNADFFEQWQKSGKRFCRSAKDKNTQAWVSFDFVTDFQNYDFVFNAHKIKAKTLLVTGENDLSSTEYNNFRLFEKIISSKELVIIENCPHTFDSKENQRDLYEAIDSWLKN